MPISMNMKHLKKVLLQKSLYDFLKEFWETYEPFELHEHWTLEYLCECFMFSVKHFLPSYIWKDWINDETYQKLKEDTGGHCPVRDSIFGNSYVHNHNWNMPPRHSKSTVLNVMGPVWLCTVSPVTVASVCHTATLATEMNEKRKKLIESSKYRYYFDDPELQLIRCSASDIQLQNGARLYSTPMASFTGHGADCFVAGTRVNTPQGYKNIEDISVGDIVLSYNHKTNKIQHSVVQATRKIEKNDLLRISTTDGRTIESTVDHRFWDVDNGYCRIDEFGEKSKFLKISQYEQSMSNMWKANHFTERCLSELFGKIIQLPNTISLQLLSKTIYNVVIGFCKKNKRVFNRKLLLTLVLGQGNERQTESKQTLSDMWKTIANGWAEILLKDLLEYCTTESTPENYSKKNKNVSCLRKDICVRFIQQILQSFLCGQSTSNTYDGGRKLELQNRKGVSSSVYKNKKHCSKTRQIFLPNMWKNVTLQNSSTREYSEDSSKSCCSPFGWKQKKQSGTESNNILSFLSYKTAQTKIATKEYIKQNKYVYDIQVADNHNFFVEDILVHNCIIADDLVSSDNAKRDQKIMRNAITFFRSTLPTRLNNKNTGVIWHIQQRLGMGDVAGTILDDKELRKVYSHTELKAISETDETIIFPCTGKVIEIKKGQPLWEQRFGDYTSIKAEVGTADFETQYNQNPEASLSNIIKEQYINWVTPEQAQKFINESEIQYASHDCPVKDKESNDFHGYCNGYGKASQLLITDGWEQHMALIKEKELMERLQKISPSLIQIIEDKANGSALLQLLKTEVSGLVAFNPGTDSKTQRLSLASVYMQNGSVMFEDNPNVRYLVKQLLKFPYLMHDDIVDAFSQMVLYHFTGATSGVYTNYFTNNNVTIEQVPDNYLYYSYAATISMDKIKVIAVRPDYSKDIYYVDKEYLFTGITATKDFEQFCITNVKGHNTILDCSFNKVLSSMISNYSIIFDTVDDTDIIKSTQLLKNGFYKKKVFVNQNCSGTINDIAKLRIDDQAVEKGIMDKLDTIDEGYEGCLRQLIQHYKGLNGVWY